MCQTSRIIRVCATPANNIQFGLRSSSLIACLSSHLCKPKTGSEERRYARFLGAFILLLAVILGIRLRWYLQLIMSYGLAAADIMLKGPANPLIPRSISVISTLSDLFSEINQNTHVSLRSFVLEDMNYVHENRCNWPSPSSRGDCLGWQLLP